MGAAAESARGQADKVDDAGSADRRRRGTPAGRQGDPVEFHPVDDAAGQDAADQIAAVPDRSDGDRSGLGRRAARAMAARGALQRDTGMAELQAAEPGPADSEAPVFSEVPVVGVEVHRARPFTTEGADGPAHGWRWSAVVEDVRRSHGHLRFESRFHVVRQEDQGCCLGLDAVSAPGVGTAGVVLSGRSGAGQLPGRRAGGSVAGFPVSITPDEARTAVMGQLELVSGIGPATASKLRGQGLVSIEHLVGSQRYGPEAEAICGEWAGGDLVALCDRLRRRLAGRGHLLATLVTATVHPRDIVFLDVETLGLAGNTIFLCGLGHWVGEQVEVKQLLAPSFGDEPALLRAVARALASAKVVVTYNGRTADMAWLRSRCFYHGLPEMPSIAHVDLLFGTRRRFVCDDGVLGDVRLVTVQQGVLEMDRPDNDIPGAAVPELYQEYQRTGCEGLLIPVLDHNRTDVEALGPLLQVLRREALAWCR